MNSVRVKESAVHLVQDWSEDLGIILYENDESTFWGEIPTTSERVAVIPDNLELLQTIVVAHTGLTFAELTLKQQICWALLQSLLLPETQHPPENE